MSVAILLIIITALVSYANGANDNFKGVATLYGGGTTSYRSALLWANATTLAGALFAVVIGHGLSRTFGGGGLVPDAVVRSTPFLASVGLAAAGTVLLATRTGLPVSTTHALMGSLSGAGLVAAPTVFNFTTLGSKFLLPLLVSPFAAFAATVAAYPILATTRRLLGITKSSCGCIALSEPAPVKIGDGVAMTSNPSPITLGTVSECRERYDGRVIGISAQSVLNVLHYGSAGAVGFARGLNDAPKIAALAVAGAALPFHQVVFLAAGAMLLGGIFGTRRIADTMGKRITAMNDGQGLTANAVTASLVLLGCAASLPLSTTHISCGALFGLGAATKGARRRMIAGIIASWFATLPLAALLGALIYAAMKGITG